MVEEELKRQARTIDPYLGSNVSDLLYGRPTEYLQVFVSSQMNSGGLKVLVDERAAAIDAINAIEGTKPWAWEISAPIGMYHSETICVEYARNSDMLVLILAEELTNITHKEYKAAKQGHAQCCIFSKSDVAPTDRVKQFIKSERRHASTGKFGNASELKTQITRAIMTHLIRSARTQQAHSRILAARKRRTRRVAP